MRSSRPETLKEALLEMQQYYKAPQTTPQWLQDDVIRMINPSYTLIGLYGFSGESFVFKVKNEAGKYRCLKIARPGEGIEGLRTVRINDKLNASVKIVDPAAKRYFDGAKMQEAIYEKIKEEQITSFAVPCVYQIASKPTLYMEMEWIESEPMLTYLKDKKDIVTSMLHFLRLLEAIEFIHDYGIVHRDIKATNIMPYKNFGIVLLDWTMSKQIGDRGLTVQGAALGTLPYASPRLMRNAKTATYLDDIHQLGYTFWSFITCREPPLFENDDIDLYEDDLIKYRHTLQKNDKYKIAEPFLSIFLKSTEPNEDRRYQTVGEMRDDVNNVLTQITAHRSKTVVDINSVDILAACGIQAKDANVLPQTPQLALSLSDLLASDDPTLILQPSETQQSIIKKFLEGLYKKYNCNTEIEKKIIDMYVQIASDTYAMLSTKRFIK